MEINTEKDIEQKISAAETTVRTVVARRNSSYFSLAISLVLLIYAAPKAIGNSTYLLVAALCVVYLGLNIWRILSFSRRKNQLEGELSEYRSRTTADSPDQLADS